MRMRTGRTGRGPRRSRCVHAEILELEDRRLLTLLGQQLFPSDNPWNQKIADAPVAANSAAIINNIISLYGDGRLHPDFGQDTTGSSAALRHPVQRRPRQHASRRSTSSSTPIADESDLQDAPIPANAVLEGDFQNGPEVGVDNRGDSHLIVWDEDNNIAYEFYRASRPSENADGQWHADQESVWDMKTNTFRTLGWTSADAAGPVDPARPGPARRGAAGQPGRPGRHQPRHPLHAAEQHHPQPVPLPGLARRQPGQHQRRRSSRRWAPASASRPASTSRSSTRESQVIAQAMKDYGMIVADNGSNFFFSGASYSVDASNQLRADLERQRHPGLDPRPEEPALTATSRWST